MTRRRTSVAIGSLIALAIIAAILNRLYQSDDQIESRGATFYIADPVIRLSPQPLSPMDGPTSPLTIGGQGEFLPPAGSYDGPGAAIGISLPGGNLTDAMKIANSPEIIDALRQQAEMKFGKGESVPIGGPATAGSVINIKGRDIQMPDTVQIDGFLGNATCQVGMPCLEMPIYTLRNIETGNVIAVSVPSGVVGDPNLPPDELAAIRSEFQWLIDAIEKVD